MIDKQYGKLILICNICDREIRFTDDDKFQDVIDFCKDNGWRIRKVGDDWEHYCDKCVARK